MMEHHLKTLPEYFEAVAADRKTFEVRRDDRPFAEGDTLLLEEWDGTTYTGRTVRVSVTYVLPGAYCRDGYCIMGIKLDEAAADRWIPVSERLPGRGEDVLVAFDDGFVASATYMDDWELWADSG